MNLPDETVPGGRLNPLRLPEDRAEFEAQRVDGFPYVGVTGSAFPGVEGTVTLVMNGVYLDMDVDYAKLIVIMLADAIKGAKKHNEGLAAAAEVE